jgi:pimeloyl-ACP methyl ester carboxylesterase
MLEFSHRPSTNVLEIAYADTGPPNGPQVILLHGCPDAARAWFPVAARLNAAGFRTIVPQLRGSGGTRFLRADTIRDGSGVALAQDMIDLADGLKLIASIWSVMTREHAPRTRWLRSKPAVSCRERTYFVSALASPSI